ncbi:MAG TPA: hypothetical protein VMF69_06645 [Gemmataceae bacterium]|nr:hypothetical protein [Gemmataceae bacterium]
MTRVDCKEIPAIAAVSALLPEQVLTTNDSTQVSDFIRRKDFAPLLHKAVTLVCELFPKLRAVILEASSDPEESAEWVVLRVTSAAPRAELTAAYRHYIQRWVRETPPEKRHLIRLSYTSE